MSGLRAGSRVAVVGLAATLAGCWWPAPGAGPDRRAHNGAETTITADTAGSLHQIWSAPTDGPAGDPVTSGAGVHVEGTDHAYGFRTDGSLRWSVPVPGGHGDIADFTAVLVEGDRVLAVHEGLESTEFAPDANAGVWLDPRTGAPVGPGTTADGVRDGLAAGSHSQYLDGIYGESLQIADAETGEVLYGGLLSISFIGSPPEAPSHVTLGAGPVFQSGPGLPADQQGIADLGVRAFPRQGAARNCGPPQIPSFACPTWTTDLAGSVATPVVVSADQSMLYVGVDDTLHVLDAVTGEVLWTAPAGSSITDAPAVGLGHVFVPTSGGELVVVPEDGCGSAVCAASWTGATGGAVSVQPAVVGSGAGAVVITGGADGGLDAFAVAGCGAASCPPIWSGPAGSPVTGAPAVSNGQVYVGTAAGLVAFGV